MKKQTMKTCPYCGNLIDVAERQGQLFSNCLDCRVGWIDEMLFARGTGDVGLWTEIKDTLLVRQEQAET